MNNVAYLYKITNTINDLVYIGVTKNPKVRFRGHAFHNTKTRSLLKNAIKKYGAENFRMELLCMSTVDYCYEMEIKAIEAYNARTPNGYNICTGGRGSRGLTGEFNGMYGRRGELHPHYGKPGYRTGIKATEETKAKMSESHRGMKHSEESKERMRELARNRSPELLAKMAEARRQAFARKKAIKNNE